MLTIIVIQNNIINIHDSIKIICHVYFIPTTIFGQISFKIKYPIRTQIKQTVVLEIWIIPIVSNGIDYFGQNLPPQSNFFTSGRSLKTSFAVMLLTAPIIFFGAFEGTL